MGSYLRIQSNPQNGNIIGPKHLFAVGVNSFRATLLMKIKRQSLAETYLCENILPTVLFSDSLYEKQSCQPHLLKLCADLLVLNIKHSR